MSRKITKPIRVSIETYGKATELMYEWRFKTLGSVIDRIVGEYKDA